MLSLSRGNSCGVNFYSTLAQLVVRQTVNLRDFRSNRKGGANFLFHDGVIAL